MGTDDDASTAAPQVTGCYRQRRYFLVVGTVCGTLFFLAGCVLTVLVLLNADGSIPEPVPFALMGAPVWLGFTLLGVWLVVSYLRHRLHIDERTITKTGVMSTTTVTISDIRLARWRRYPGGGSLVLQTITAKIKIYFGEYDSHHARVLVAHFRECLDQDLQVGWPRFADEILESGPKRQRQARSSGVVFNLILAAFAAFFLCCWLAGMGNHLLIVAAINAILVGYRIYRTRRSKSPDQTPPPSGSDGIHSG